MAVDESLFRLMTVAEEQQAAVAKAIQALATERAALAAERAAIPQTIASAISAQMKASKDELAGAAESMHYAASAIRWKIVTIAMLSTIAICGTLYEVTRYQLSQIAEYSDAVEKLKAQGGRVTLTGCGPSRRLCALINTSESAFGTNGEYRILSGY